MYDLVDMLTYKLRSISQSMWPVFEWTYKVFKHEAIDFLDGMITPWASIYNQIIFGLEMLPSLDNFVSYGSDVIKGRPDYKKMLVDIYTTSITNDQLGENDRVNGSKLAESILLNLRANVDEVRLLVFFLKCCPIDKRFSSICKPLLALPSISSIIQKRLHCVLQILKFWSIVFSTTHQPHFTWWKPIHLALHDLSLTVGLPQLTKTRSVYLVCMTRNLLWLLCALWWKCQQLPYQSHWGMDGLVSSLERWMFLKRFRKLSRVCVLTKFTYHLWLTFYRPEKARTAPARRSGYWGGGWRTEFGLWWRCVN